MTSDHHTTSPLFWARIAGGLYLAIIVLGISAELFVRGGLMVPGEPAATAGNIMAAPGLFRAGFFADSVMFLCDVALAVLLFVLLKPVNRTIALMAMCFRLTQTAVLALNLLHYHAALLLLEGPGYSALFTAQSRDALAAFLLDVHGHGYDLGLIPFGINCLLLGYLIIKSRYLPRFLGVLMIAAGLTYLVGSYTRFLFPGWNEAVSPVYVVPFAAELSFALWMLIKGVDERQWEIATRPAPAPADA